MAYKKRGKRNERRRDSRREVYFLVCRQQQHVLSYKTQSFLSSLVVWLLRCGRPRPDASLTRCFSFFITQRQSPSSLLREDEKRKTLISISARVPITTHSHSHARTHATQHMTQHNVSSTPTTTTPSSSSSASTLLTVVQYNTLADALCTGDDAGFTSLPPQQLSWAARGDGLVRAVLASDADVVCLQEVDHYHDTFFPRLAARGYAGCFKEDEWSPCRKLSDGSLRDGVAIFYKREKLELCGMHAPCTPRASKDVDVDGGGQSMEDAGKCLIARFRVLPPRKMTHGERWAQHTCAMEEVVVATVHLDSKKNQQGLVKRTRQAARCARAVREFRDFSCSNPASAAVIVAGDLNAVPHEPAVKIFKGGGGAVRGGGSGGGESFQREETQASSLAAAAAAAAAPAASSSSSPLSMFSAYERCLGAEPPFTTWKIRTGEYKPGEAKMTIDYIFVSEGCEVDEVGGLDDEAAIGPKGLPCATHPSDHLLLRASVRLPPPPSSQAS